MPNAKPRRDIYVGGARGGSRYFYNKARLKAKDQEALDNGYELCQNCNRPFKDPNRKHYADYKNKIHCIPKIKD